ncbi:MAG: alpha/beta hydrolase [Actinobacteria bacterium]|nr:MAG: alpha/beta hydrolase [Actinomycetota bacterium]
MNEHPIFVPRGRESLAAVVTTPEGACRAGVLLLQGSAGTPRSHRNRLWVRTARSLADRGFAAIRMDYRGVGDSTGTYEFEMDRPPVADALAVTELVLDALGLHRVGVVGNCVGTRVALGLATRLPACVSVASVLPMSLGPVLSGRGRSRPTRAAFDFLRRHPTLRQASHRLGSGRVARGLGAPPRFIPEVGVALRSAHLLFLHGGTDHSRAKLARGVEQLRQEAAGNGHRRVEMWRLDFEGRTGFRPIEVQASLIDSVVRWMDETLPSPGAPGVVTMPEAGAAPVQGPS